MMATLTFESPAAKTVPIDRLRLLRPAYPRQIWIEIPTEREQLASLAAASSNNGQNRGFRHRPVIRQASSHANESHSASHGLHGNDLLRARRRKRLRHKE